jgi:hypothetical protein
VYRWIATYEGDANHTAIAGVCGEASETTVVHKYTPGLTTSASAPVAFGGAVTDTATMSGGLSPAGTVTFALYGPNDEDCSAPPAFTAIKTMSGYVNPSPSFIPTAVGTYRWIARYSGDVRNNAVAGTCGEPNETVTVGLPRLISIVKDSSDVTIIFEGRPGGNYRIQTCPSPSPLETWTTISGSLTADEQGRFTFSESTSDRTKYYCAIP